MWSRRSESYEHKRPTPLSGEEEEAALLGLLGSSWEKKGGGYPAMRAVMVRRTSGHLAPAVSLNSFVLGFLIGCVVLYALHCTGSVDICIDCKTQRIPLPYPPSAAPSLRTPHITTTETTENTTSVKFSSETPRTAHVTPVAAGCPRRPLRLVVLILSTPGGSLRRNAIRGTWMHDSPASLLELTLRFVVGTKELTQDQFSPLSAEADMFQDIFFLSQHKEAYSNLTAKVLSSLVWADGNLEFDFLVKADDDSYVRLPALESALRDLGCPPDLYWGYFMGHAVPETAGRWAERHWTICPHYLPYAMGGGYVLGRHVVKLIGQFHKQFRLYSNEDVSLGSWLAPFNVAYHHDLRFNTEAASHGCNNHYIISHKEKVRGMYEKYVHLQKNGTMCVEEKEIRPAYLYNWTAASPLECCDRIKGLPVPP